MYFNRSNERKWFLTKKKARSLQYPAGTNTDANNTGDIALLANTPAQVKSLLHSLELTARSSGLYMNR